MVWPRVNLVASLSLIRNCPRKMLLLFQSLFGPRKTSLAYGVRLGTKPIMTWRGNCPSRRGVTLFVSSWALFRPNLAHRLNHFVLHYVRRRPVFVSSYIKLVVVRCVVSWLSSRDLHFVDDGITWSAVTQHFPPISKQDGAESERSCLGSLPHPPGPPTY